MVIMKIKMSHNVRLCIACQTVASLPDYITSYPRNTYLTKFIIVMCVVSVGSAEYLCNIIFLSAVSISIMCRTVINVLQNCV